MTLTPSRPVVAPTPTRLTRTTPLPGNGVRLRNGFWRDRQEVNRQVSLELGAKCLRDAGNLQNFRNLIDGGANTHGHAGAADGDVRNFVDSDVYKWLEAVGWESSRGSLSAGIEATAEESIQLILAAQSPDGYVNTWYQTQPAASRFSNLAYGHELYCLGHLIQAGIAWSRVRGDVRLLDAARRFADLVVDLFGSATSVVVCGHPQIEMALVELSRETGDDRYARLAKAFIDRRGRGFLGEGRFGATYYQDRVPYRAMSNVEGHAVRALYLGCGAVDVATEFGDIELLQAAKQQWTNMVASKTYLTGGVGSRHWGESFGDDFELPSDRAYCETCAAIGVVMWSWRLLLAEPDARLADLIERALFNGMLAGVSLDGSRYHYVNPLRVRGSHPRQPWFEIACCPPNLMRTLATLDHYVASRDDLGVYVHQFTSADIDAGGTRQLHMETTYPSGDVVRLVVDTDADRPWTLRLRIPSWAGEGFALSLNGQPATGIIISGYLELTRQWNAGDALELTLPMAPRLTRAVTSVENLQGQAAIERGPLVFCVEQCDLPVDLHPDDLVVVAGGELKDVDATVAEVPGVHVRGGLARRDRHVWPFPGHGEQTVECVAAAVEAVAVPYFAWGNRAVGAMRVWVRTHDEMGEMA